MEEIIKICNEIFQNLELNQTAEEVFNDLFNEKIYLNIYKIMFPFLIVNLQKIERKESRVGEKIQALIDLLSNDILTMDLSHIRGSQIARGDLKHLLNFLQLLLEVSKLFRFRKRTEKENQINDDFIVQSDPNTRKSSQRKSVNSADAKRAHSVQGIENEFEGQPQQGEEDQDDDAQMEEIQQQFYEFQRVTNGTLEDFLDQAGPEVQKLIIKKLTKQSQLEEQTPQKLAKSAQQQNEYEQIQQQMSGQQQKSSQKSQQQQIHSNKTSEKKQKNEIEIRDMISQKQNVVENINENPLEEDGGKMQVGEGLIKDDQYSSEESNEGHHNFIGEKQLKDQNQQEEMVISQEQQQKLLMQQQYEQQLEQQQNQKQQFGGQENLFNKSKQKKKIEKNIFQGSVVGQQRFLTTNPNKKKGGKQAQMDKMVQDNQLIQQQQQQLQDDEINPQELEQYQQQFEQIKNQEEEQNENIDNYNLPNNDNRLYDILSQNIKKIKDNLNNMRQIQLPEDEPQTRAKLIRQKQEYKKLLKEYLECHRITQMQQNKKLRQTQNLQSKIRNITAKDIDFQQQLENEQKSMCYKLRDEKFNYLRKIHRIIFELEKRKIIDEKKFYKDLRKQRNEETRHVLDSIENAYKDKIDILRQKLKNQRKERHVAEVAQRQVIQNLEKELREEKLNQISSLKSQWKTEKEKFDVFVRDDGLLEQQIMELYKKF